MGERGGILAVKLVTENVLMQRYDATREETSTDQHNALVIFAVKRITISEISKKVLNNILAECDRTSPIKNFTG